MRTTRTIIGIVVAAVIIVVGGCDFGPESTTSSVPAFGVTHAALGSANLLPQGESVLVDLGGPGAAGGVSVDVDQRDRLNVYFDPIEMPVGSFFEVAVVGQVNGREETLGRITHRQSGQRTTAIGLDFHELAAYSKSTDLTVATYVDGVETFSKRIPIDSTETVGFVDSGESGWATSYHWVYINGAWGLMIDPAPSETFTLASDPSKHMPFNFLVFTIDGVEGVGQPETMEFFGEGLSQFKIVGENDRRLIF